jgi:hypothetical protein
MYFPYFLIFSFVFRNHCAFPLLFFLSTYAGRTSRLAAAPALAWLAAEPSRTWPFGMGGRRDETTLAYLRGLALGG